MLHKFTYATILTRSNFPISVNITGSFQNSDANVLQYIKESISGEGIDTDLALIKHYLPKGNICGRGGWHIWISEEGSSNERIALIEYPRN